MAKVENTNDEDEMGLHFLAFSDFQPIANEEESDHEDEGDEDYEETEDDEEADEIASEENDSDWETYAEKIKSKSTKKKKKKPQQKFQDKTRSSRRCAICHRSPRYYPDLKMHQFPTAGRLKDLWLEKLSIEPKKFENHFRICSNHFSEDDYSEKGLKKSAFPTLNLEKNFVNEPEPRKKPSSTCKRSCLLCRKSYRNTPNLRLFRFPSGYYREIWMQKCELEPKDLMKSRPSLCDRHFEKRYIGPKKLREDAVPTRNLNQKVDHLLKSESSQNESDDDGPDEIIPKKKDRKRPAEEYTAIPPHEIKHHRPKEKNKLNTETNDVTPNKRTATPNEETVANEKNAAALNNVDCESILPDVSIKEEFEITFIDTEVPSPTNNKKQRETRSRQVLANPQSNSGSKMPMPKLVPLKSKVDEYFKQMSLKWMKDFPNLPHAQKILAQKLMNEVMAAAQQGNLVNESSLVVSTSKTKKK